MAMLTPVTVKQLLNNNTPSYPLSMSLLVCFISFLLVWKLKRRSRLINLPPSPPRLPIIGNLHQLSTLPHRSFAELSQKYGPIMLLHLGQAPTLVVSSADLAREIMKTHDISFADRPQTRAVKILLYGCNDVGFASYGEEWRQKKKICVVELLSMKRVRSFHSIREEEVADMVNNIREACASNDGCSVNLSDMLIATSNNIVCRCVIGDKYNTKDNSRFGELARKVMIHIASFSVGDLFPSLGWIDVFTGKIREFKATFEALDAFFEQVIAEHKIRKRNSDSNNSDKKDFVDILLQLEEDGMLDFELTHQNLKALVMV
ncbi:hypothetical protein L6164_011009 [Bauhinia variegata]|uniref:Uncharacterized protein n=1 Tax=Bauhinia variegata TaxID=167791 RepID=A0ACB9P4I2_BAUVA|nr:hypothetical protein L6164_011009 [Bauhinia variegata]